MEEELAGLPDGRLLTSKVINDEGKYELRIDGRRIYTSPPGPKEAAENYRYWRKTVRFTLGFGLLALLVCIPSTWYWHTNEMHELAFKHPLSYIIIVSWAIGLTFTIVGLGWLLQRPPKPESMR